MLKLRISIFLLLQWLLLGFAHAAEITVTTDRNPVNIDETFQIIFTLKGDNQAQPDFSPLKKHFTILGTNQSSNTKIINGNIEQSLKWVLTVMAKKTGTLEIPAVSLGKQKSKPIEVVVNKPTSISTVDEDIFLEINIKPQDVYVQEQIIARVKLFRAVATSNASLSELFTSGVNTVVEKLDDDKQYRTRQAGKVYEVYERSYAIFPQGSGNLTIEPVRFQAQLGVNGGFFADPFAPPPKVIIKQTEAVKLSVKPIPGTFVGKHWLPASKLILNEEWSVQPPQFIAGQPITRTITLQAMGLTASQLPEIVQHLPEGLKTYADQPDLKDEKFSDGIIGMRREKVAVIPAQTGTMVLPEIKLAYWSRTEGKIAYATIPERSITVLPAVNKTGQGEQAEVPSAAEATASEMESLNAAPLSDDSVPDSTAETTGSYWIWLSIFFCLGWLITGVLWWRQTHVRRNNKAEAVPEKQTHMLKAIKNACSAGDAQQCKTALLKWAALVWPERPPANLQELAQNTDPEIQAALHKLDQVLYGKGKQLWQGNNFWQEFSEYLQGLNNGNKSRRATESESLFRLAS